MKAVFASCPVCVCCLLTTRKRRARSTEASLRSFTTTLHDSLPSGKSRKAERKMKLIHKKMKKKYEDVAQCRTHSFLSPPERKTKETDIPFNKREKTVTRYLEVQARNRNLPEEKRKPTDWK